MAFAAKLCNPTPFDCDLNYEKGVMLHIPAFGSCNLTGDQQLDYDPRQPGAEGVQEENDFFGLFLLDVDRPYENQALEAITKSHARKLQRYREITQGHRDRAARQNLTITEESFKEIERMMGCDVLYQQVEKLAKLMEQYKAVVKGDDHTRKVRQLDPARTIFALNPPREFDSVITRQFYLDENPEVAEREATIRESMAEQADREIPEDE
jgi:hypothetical protein